MDVGFSSSRHCPSAGSVLFACLLTLARTICRLGFLTLRPTGVRCKRRPCRYASSVLLKCCIIIIYFGLGAAAQRPAWYLLSDIRFTCHVCFVCFFPRKRNWRYSCGRAVIRSPPTRFSGCKRRCDTDRESTRLIRWKWKPSSTKRRKSSTKFISPTTRTRWILGISFFFSLSLSLWVSTTSFQFHWVVLYFLFSFQCLNAQFPGLWSRFFHQG